MARKTAKQPHDDDGLSWKGRNAITSRPSESPKESACGIRLVLSPVWWVGEEKALMGAS